MEWLERMNRAIDYIEANLTGEIELSEAARMACCSSYQFQRMFSFISDATLSEYIRRRRFEVFGIEGIFRTDGGWKAPQTPAKLWEQSNANGDVKRLEARAGDSPSFVGRDLHHIVRCIE